MDQSSLIAKYLSKLGIEPETTKVYIELSKLGHSSALQLAKSLAISRTQIYRHLEALQQYGLVSAEQLNYGTLYRALPLENVEGLLVTKEAETAAIRRNLSGMVQALQLIVGEKGSQPKATVQHYYGVAGVKQATWNITKADGEYRCFEAAHLSKHLDKAFARKHRERSLERKLVSYDLTNDLTVHAKEIEPFEPSRTFLRHIDPKILALDFEVVIYNDVVTLFDFTKDNLMAIEIHHPSLHKLMRQLFDAMWAMAEPLEITP